MRTGNYRSPYGGSESAMSGEYLCRTVGGKVATPCTMVTFDAVLFAIHRVYMAFYASRYKKATGCSSK